MTWIRDRTTIGHRSVILKSTTKKAGLRLTSKKQGVQTYLKQAEHRSSKKYFQRTLPWFGVVSTCRSYQLTMSTTSPTTETELTGINMADTSGDRCPVMAKDSPTMLYKNEKAKATFTTPCIRETKVRKPGSSVKAWESRMASQAGENW